MSTIVDKPPFEYEKEPAEKEIIGVNFSRRIPSGVTISMYEVTSALFDNSPEKIAEAADLGPHLSVSSIVVVGKILTCMISDGVDTFKYKVTFKVTLSDGQLKEDNVRVKVIEK